MLYERLWASIIMTLEILALSGSQRTKSWCTALLLATKALAPTGINLHIFEAHKHWPLFNPDLESELPVSVKELRELITAADAILIASPEYAHGVTATIKNTLDWLVSYPDFASKPVAVFNPSYQSHHADDALKETLRTMSAHLIPGACIRIPVIGSGIDQASIQHTPRFSTLIRNALESLEDHAKRTQPKSDN